MPVYPGAATTSPSFTVTKSPPWGPETAPTTVTPPLRTHPPPTALIPAATETEWPTFGRQPHERPAVRRAASVTASLLLFVSAAQKRKPINRGRLATMEAFRDGSAQE